ncbi:MAG: sugar transferase [Actinomycetes bacterium]
MRRHRAYRMPWVLLGADALAFVAAITYVDEISRRTLLMGALTIALFWAGGLYRPRLTPAALDDFPSLVGRALIAGAVITGLGAFDDGRAGRVTLLCAMVFAGLTVAGRALVYGGMNVARRRGLLQHRTLILGGGAMAENLAETLLEHREIGLHPVGFLDDDPLMDVNSSPVPHLGSYSNLVNVILDEDISHVVVAFGSLRESHVVDLLRDCDRLACEIFFVPRLYELHAMQRDMEMAWGTPLVRLRRAPFRTLAWRVKRGVDVVAALLALVLLSPVLAACALAVRLSIGRHVIFRQERVGLDGRPFTLLKFCSLMPADPSESAQRWNVSDDDRLTRVGRILRRTSLDELPQLWNILRGDMSLVGPRPERPFFVATFTERFPRYMARHRVPAGLTGAAQVAGLRGDTSIAERARFDNYYIENWSLWGDCKLLLRTIGQVLRGAGR